MASEFGNRLKVSLFGESHGDAVGMVLSGLPAGESIDLEALDAFLARRRGGKAGTTARTETDKPVFLSGLTGGKTNGAPLCAYIVNENVRREDYAALTAPRPGHADYTAHIKWHGQSDLSGGGHLSGRLTAPLCAAGGIARQILARRGIFTGSHVLSCAGVEDRPFSLSPDVRELEAPAANWPPCLDTDAGAKMLAALSALCGDSAGGIAECVVTGLPAGLGDPLFDGVESRMSRTLFGIPAVKGVEFGSGFAGAHSTGSQNNDPFLSGGKTASNHAGGILGGITNGMPLVVRCAFKPTPTIDREQQSVSFDGETPVSVRIPGRHDPCVALRGAVCAEAAAALVCLDLLLEGV